MVAERGSNTLSAHGGDSLVAAWLERFAACVRARDFDGARTLFDINVGSFGTWTGHMRGLDELVARQWRHVWPKTCGFSFAIDRAFGGLNDTSGWVAATWKSRAVNADGTPGFERSGRATFVFRRSNDELIAVHTHFSIDPAGRLG